MKSWKKFVGIIIAPKKTFLYLKDKPDWKVPVFANLASVGLLFLTGEYLSIITSVYESLAQFLFVFIVGVVTGGGTIFLAYILVWGILAGALYLSGKMLKVRFTRGQLYTISGYSFFVPDLIFGVVYSIYELANPSSVTADITADTAFEFSSIFPTVLLGYTLEFSIIWSIALMGVGVWCVVGKLRKTLLIVITSCVLVLLSQSGFRLIFP